MITCIRGCIQKFPDWPPGARTANGTALCHQVQLYPYFVNLLSFAAITLCVASQRVFIVVSVYFVIDSVRKRLDTSSYYHSSVSTSTDQSIHPITELQFLHSVNPPLPNVSMHHATSGSSLSYTPPTYRVSLDTCS
jgi:hypothetical protein